jgi:hypothetical protein
MNEREEEKLKEILLPFLQKFTEDSMAIEAIDLWPQKWVLETDLVTAKGKGAATSRNNNRRKDEELPQVYSLEVTVIMSISYSFLPPNLLGSMAAETVDDNQELLLGLLRGQNSFYAYFKEMDSIDSVAIEGVTIPPTQSPITQAQALEEATIASEISEEAPSGNNFAVFVGVGVAALWCCLTAISVTYVLKMRGEMEEMRDMENLLAQEKKATPIMTGDVEECKKVGSAKEDEEAPLSRWDGEKVTESRRQIDADANADSELGARSSMSASKRVPVSRKSSHGASISRSEHTGDGGERRRSRKSSLRDSLTGSGLRSSLTELKGSFNKSIRQVSRGVESVRRDGVIRSSRRSSRNPSTGDRRRSSARMSMGSRTSNNSVDPRSSTPNRVRHGSKAGSMSASTRSSIKVSTTNSVTSSRQGSRISVTDRVGGAHESDRGKRERGSVAKEKKDVGAALYD